MADVEGRRRQQLFSRTRRLVSREERIRRPDDRRARGSESARQPLVAAAGRCRRARRIRRSRDAEERPMGAEQAPTARFWSHRARRGGSPPCKSTWEKVARHVTNSAKKSSGNAIRYRFPNREEVSMDARAKLLGHPIHQMLIVFPLGLLAT